MNKKMRGIADPYTLGLLIALISPLVINNAQEKDTPAQQASQQQEAQQVAWVEDADD